MRVRNLDTKINLGKCKLSVESPKHCLVTQWVDIPTAVSPAVSRTKIFHYLLYYFGNVDSKCWLHSKYDWIWLNITDFVKYSNKSRFFSNSYNKNNSVLNLSFYEVHDYFSHQSSLTFQNHLLSEPLIKEHILWQCHEKVYFYTKLNGLIWSK